MTSNKTDTKNTQLQNEASKDLFEAILTSDEGILQEDNLKELSSMLLLPDEEFEILHEAYLLQLEESLTDSTTRIILAEALKRDNLKPDDAIRAFQAAIDSIDTEMDALPQNKKDFLKRFFGIAINLIQGLEGVTDRIVSIPIEKNTNVKLPTYSSTEAAGLDLYAPKEYTIKPGETIIIPTGIKVALPVGYAFLIQPRSGLSVKTGLRIANTPGLIDSDYRDEIGVIVENIEPAIADIEYNFDDDTGVPQIVSILHGKSYTIHEGDRFAQMRLVEVPTASFYEVESVSEIGQNRGGGFGSTGK